MFCVLGAEKIHSRRRLCAAPTQKQHNPFILTNPWADQPQVNKTIAKAGKIKKPRVRG